MKQVLIMAAGMGRRMGELTKITPKPLVPIMGRPIIEKSIDYMVEAKIDRVILVVGYMKERFYYLKSQYDKKIEIVIITNKEYESYNTLSTVHCARDYLDIDTWIVCADLYLINNVFLKYQRDHNFYLQRIVTNTRLPEWASTIRADGCIESVDTNAHSGSVYTGVSYWPKQDIQHISELISAVNWSDEKVKKMYWDEILFSEFSNWDVHVVHCDDVDMMEIDVLEDLQDLERSIF